MVKSELEEGEYIAPKHLYLVFKESFLGKRVGLKNFLKVFSDIFSEFRGGGGGTKTCFKTCVPRVKTNSVATHHPKKCFVCNSGEE